MQRELKTGDVVISKAGHDRGRLYMVIEVVSQDFVKVADGERRTTDSPKTKRRKHLKFVVDGALPTTDADVNIKKILKERREYAERG